MIYILAGIVGGCLLIMAADIIVEIWERAENRRRSRRPAKIIRLEDYRIPEREVRNEFQLEAAIQPGRRHPGRS